MGETGPDVYLNSEADYQDQRSLNVRLSSNAKAQLQGMLGETSIEDFFTGKPIIVRGSAYRQRIDFLDAGNPTGKYYYQTHLFVQDAQQITRP